MGHMNAAKHDRYAVLPEMMIISDLFHDLVLPCFKCIPLKNQRLETSILLLNFGTNPSYYFCNSPSTIFSSWKCSGHCFIGCREVNPLKNAIKLYINL